MTITAFEILRDFVLLVCILALLNMAVKRWQKDSNDKGRDN